MTVEESLLEEASSLDDDFERLRQVRELEKFERQKVRFNLPRLGDTVMADTVMGSSEMLSEETTAEFSEESYSGNYK